MSREMKNSGIPWIGEIPSRWRIETIGSCIKEVNEPNSDLSEDNSLQFKMGTIISKKYGDSKYNPESLEAYNKVKEGDIIINGLNLSFDFISLRVGRVEEKGVITSAYLAVRPLPFIDSHFLNYLFKGYDYCKALHSMGRGLRATLGYKEFRKYSVIFPEFEEQKAITDFLDKKCEEIDDLISLQDNIIEELKAYKQSKVKEIFDSYLQKEPYSIYKLGGLANLVTKQTGFDYANKISPSLVGEPSENTLPYLQTKNFKDGYWNYNTDYYIPKEVAVGFPKIILNKKCLLFSIVGASIGNVAVFPATTTAFLGGAICKVDLNEERNYEYVKNYMMSFYGQEQINAKINASAQGTITVQNVRDFKIPIFSSTQIQERITKEISALSETISSLIKTKQSKIEALKDYKKSIIYEYVTGKKEVPYGK